MGKLTWQQVALILAGILLGGGIITYVDLFSGLFKLTGVSYQNTGDIVCGEECESYINVSTWYWRICFAHYNGTKYENETVLFKKRTRSRTLHVDLNKVDNIISTNPLVEVDWLVPTYGNKWRPLKDGDCWDRLKTNRIKLIGHKEKSQTVKWNFKTGDFVEIDPIWKGIDTEYGATWDRSCDGGKCVTSYFMGMVNYYNGTYWNKINTTITESSNPLYDYEVTKGIYYTFFQEDSFGGEPVRFYYNESYLTGKNSNKAGYVTYKSQELKYTNALDQIQYISAVQSVVGYPEENKFTYPSIFGSGFNLSYYYYSMALKESLEIGSMNDLPEPEEYILNGGNVTLDMSFIINWKDDLDVFVDGEIWDKLTLKETKNQVDFRLDNDTVFSMKKPVSTDEADEVIDITYELKKQGTKLYVIIKTPYDWLIDVSREYPVSIDPPTIYPVNWTNANLAWDSAEGTDTPRFLTTVYYTPYNEGEYDVIESSNNVRFEHISSGTDDYWVNLFYNFSIAENVGDITSIFVLWEGYDELDDGDDFEFDIWNHTSGTWIVINTTTDAQGADVNYTNTFDSTYDFNDFIDGDGLLYLAVSGDYSPISCPFIYSWNGSDYVFDSEAFPWSWTKYWNMEINARLPNLKPYSDDTYRIKVTEEMDEVAYYDKVQLIAIDHPKGTEIYSDANNNYYTIKNPENPISCIDEDGRECLDLINKDDEQYWNLRGYYKEEGTDYTDYLSEIIVEFERKGDTAKILHKAKKSGSIAHRFGEITYGKTGYENRDYMFIEKVAEWMGLVNYIFPNMYLWNGTDWVDIYFLSETMALNKAQERVVFINLTGIDTTTLKIKYSAIDEIGGIDYVKADWSKDKKIKKTVLNISSAEFNISGEILTVTDKLKEDDSDYVIFNEGDYGYIDFQPIKPVKDSKRTFFTMDNGYYDALIKLLDDSDNDFEEEDKEILDKMMENYTYALEYLVPQLYYNSLYDDFLKVEISTEVPPPPPGVNCTFPNDYGEPKTINMTWFCNTTTAWAKNVTMIDTGWWLVNGTLNLTQNIYGDAGQIIYGGSNGTINVGSYT